MKGFEPRAAHRLRLSQIECSAWVPFAARRLRHARVAWIDPRWDARLRELFQASAGADSLHPAILHHWAFQVPAEGDAADAFEDEERTFHADRYGGDGVGYNGGSGRCGLCSRHGLQIKGIGQTPLVGEDVPFDHAHGGLSLEEGMREVIHAAILGAEHPGSCSEAVALIVSGTHVNRPSSHRRRDEPRCLLVREPLLRAAHLERSAYFRPRHANVGSGAADLERVRKVFATLVPALEGQPGDLPGGAEALSALDAQLKAMSIHAAKWAARFRAHRYFHGMLCNSNLNLDGSVVDFGTSGFLNDWAAASLVQRAPSFGQELEVLRRGRAELAFFCRKVVPEHRVDSSARFDTLSMHAFAHHLRAECLVLAGLPRSILESASRSARCDSVEVLAQQVADRMAADAATAYNLGVEASVPHPRSPMDGVPNLLFSKVPSKVELAFTLGDSLLFPTGEYIRALRSAHRLAGLAVGFAHFALACIARALQINRNRSSLVWSTLRRQNEEMIARSMGADDFPAVVRRYILDMIRSNRRLFERPEMTRAESVAGHGASARWVRQCLGLDAA